VKKNIVFIGMRGSGKSHLGSIFAKKYGYDFVDTDQEIEKKAGKKISVIITEMGWEQFRTMETEVCEETEKKSNTVVSTGGGVILNPRNIQHLKQNGIIVFLFVPLQELVRRLTHSKNKRPPLKPELSLEEEVESIWKERKDIFYDVADEVFESLFFSKNPHENVERNVELLKTMLEKERRG
jgi:shikimate kinase